MAFSLSCHSAAFPLFCYAGLSPILSLQPVFLSVPPASFLSVTLTCFFICHSGLRAGVQVNIDSLTTWIPGQARNDNYMSVIPRLRSNRQGIYEFPLSVTAQPLFLSVTLTSFFICHSGLFFICHSDLFFHLSLRPISLFCHSGLSPILSLRPPSRSPG